MQSVLEEKFNWWKSNYDAGLPPVPAYDSHSPIITTAKADLAILERQSAPASSNEFGLVMYRLQAHYWQANMSEKLAKLVADDYIRLLGHYPVAILNQAVDCWLLNPEKKFMPKIGELEEVIKSKLWQHKFKMQKLKALVENAV